MNIFQSYAAYYDSLYQEKNYSAETEYIQQLIKQYLGHAVSILDLGCGTGRHACALVHTGYRVHGVDMSKEMLHYAQQKGEEQGLLGARLSFSHGDARTVCLPETYDVVVSLFHVMSYQRRNEDVLSFLQTMVNHVKTGGIIIADFWYGPAVLAEKPEVRVKHINHDTRRLVRITEPVLQQDMNCVDINFSLFAQEQTLEYWSLIEEKHTMRYFFQSEIIAWCQALGIEILAFEAWMTRDKPSLKTRDVCLIGRKR